MAQIAQIIAIIAAGWLSAGVWDIRIGLIVGLLAYALMPYQPGR